MGQAIGDILAPAVGVAVSPMPIVAVILMLFTARARANSTAFAAGWVVGLLVVVGIVLLVADPAGVTGDEDETSTGGAILHLALGAGLLFLAAQQWKKRPTGDAEPPTPKWMQSIDGFTPVMAFGFGAFMSGLNPKNLLFDIAAGSSIAQANLSSTSAILVMLIYTVIASAVIVGIVAWALLAGSGAEAKLTAMKGWLTTHNAEVMMVLLGILGVSQIGTGIGMF